MSTLCLPARRRVSKPIYRELPRPRELPVRSRERQLHHIGDAALATILDHHPRRDSGLSRLLDDIAAFPASTAGEIHADELRRREAFDAQCDNDPDGLG